MLSDTWQSFPGIGQLYAARTPRKQTYTARLVLVTGAEITKDGFVDINAARQWGQDMVAAMVAAIEQAQEAQA